MDEQIRARDAAHALAQVRHQHERVVNAALVPRWYWWAVGVPMVGLAAIVDTGGGAAIGIAIAVFVIAVVSMSVRLVFGAHRHMQVSSDLLGGRGAVAIAGFVWLVVGATLGIGFALEFAGARYPATIACLAGAVGLVAGGPVLMSRLRQIMLDNQPGGAA